MKRIGLLFITLLLATCGCTRAASTSAPQSVATAGGTRLCAAADLRTSSNSNDASGSIQIGVTLVNVSQTACLVIGPPPVTMMGNGRVLDLQIIQAPSDQTPPAPPAVMVAPGNSIVAILLWSNYCGGALAGGPTLHLALTTDQGLDIPLEPQAVPDCTAQNQPSTLTINPYSFPP